MRTVLCVLLLATAAAGCDQKSRPLVATREGLLRGVVGRSAGGAVFYSFKGIPYAKPPVGPLRFQPPQRHPGWSGVTDALEHNNKCLQIDFFKNMTLQGDEDCLFANVYTPQLPKLKGEVGGLPVMVWIHGGGFFFGDGNTEYYGPNYFMDEAVVLVTLNYRLGPFGFFTTNDKHASGNYGLLDQVLLLQWVRDNIASFGGDPNSVTIFGESAGGASVSLLVLSHLTKGLIHHAISQSGSSVASFAASGRRKNSAEKFAKLLNCTNDDVGEMVECVRNAPALELMDGVKSLGLEMQMHFLPSVDSEAEDPLLPKDPRILVETGNFNLIPWMNGIAEEEGAGMGTFFLAANETLMSGLSAGDHDAWVFLSDLAEDDDLDCGSSVKEVVAKIQDFYTKDGPVSADNLLPMAQLVSDRHFVASMSEEVRLASAHAPVYKFVLNHRGPGRLTLASLLGIDLGENENLGVSHGSDILYLFNNAKTAMPPADSPANSMVRFMVGLWTSFARTGRPSSQVFDTPDWPIFTEQSQQHMNLNSQPTVGERLYEERVQFWRSLPVNEPWKHAVKTEPCPSAPPAETGGY